MHLQRSLATAVLACLVLGLPAHCKKGGSGGGIGDIIGHGDGDGGWKHAGTFLKGDGDGGWKHAGTFLKGDGDGGWKHAGEVLHGDGDGGWKHAADVVHGHGDGDGWKHAELPGTHGHGHGHGAPPFAPDFHHGSFRAQEQHTINALHPEGHARAAAEHAADAANSTVKHDGKHLYFQH